MMSLSHILYYACINWRTPQSLLNASHLFLLALQLTLTATGELFF